MEKGGREGKDDMKEERGKVKTRTAKKGRGQGQVKKEEDIDRKER